MITKLTLCSFFFFTLITFSLNSLACDSRVSDRAKMTIENAITLKKTSQSALLYNMDTGGCDNLELTGKQQDVRQFIPQDEISIGAYNFSLLDGLDSMAVLKQAYKLK